MNWEYIAGYFDADGNIHVAFNSKKVSFQAIFRIYSTNKTVLEEIRNFVGLGNIYSRKDTINNPKRSICYEYIIGKKDEVKFVLDKINSHLIVKKLQIDYLLKNFNFSRDKNKDFSLKEFRKPITRKNQDIQRKY